MNNKLLDWFTAHASLKNIVIALMAVIPFNALLFPLLMRQITAQSGGIGMLDITLGYLPQSAIRAVEAYGTSGRTWYLIAQWTADLLFPIAYTFLFSLLLASLYRRAFSPDSPFQNLRWAPIGMMGFDYLENITISLLLILFPNSPLALTVIASIASLLKWVLAATAGIALLVGLAALIRKSFPQPDHKGV